MDRPIRLEMIAFGIEQLEILQREGGSIARRLEILADAGERRVTSAGWRRRPDRTPQLRGA
jgi:hypothetical protein